jgi:tRNA-dihydrouridine synthase 1
MKRNREDRMHEKAEEAKHAGSAPPPQRTDELEGSAPVPKHVRTMSLVPSPTAVSLPPPRRPLPPHQFILAPMVGGSELAFRLLARRHGCQLCYTPMILPEEWHKKGGGVALLERHPDDAPLVAHFGGNDPGELLACAKRAERCPGVAAIDLNLGCPQRSAHSGHFGAFLCVTPADRQLVLRIVSTLARSLSVPMFCKIRLLDEWDETLLFVEQLVAAGCALLAVHGRYRGSPMHRRDGPAHLDKVELIKQHLKGKIPVITNGNVRNAAELIAALELTGADGVMSAEGALDDPAIFGRAAALARVRRRDLQGEIRRAKERRETKRAGGRQLSAEEKALVAGRKAARERLRILDGLAVIGLPRPPSWTASDADANADADAAAKGAADPSLSAAHGGPAHGGPSGLDLADQYLELVKAHPPPLHTGVARTLAAAQVEHSIFHVRRLAKPHLNAYVLMGSLEAATSLEAIENIVRRCREYSEGKFTFTPGIEAERRAREAHEARRAANAARRAEFVERMRAKARAEGHADEEWYLRHGREPPSTADVERARRLGQLLGPKELTKLWRERWGQHCQGWYCEGKCPHAADVRGCGFLHGGECPVA